MTFLLTSRVTRVQYVFHLRPSSHTMPALHVYVSPSAYVLGIAGCVIGLLTFGNRSSPLVWANLSLRDREALRAFAQTSLVVLGSMPFISHCLLA